MNAHLAIVLALAGLAAACAGSGAAGEADGPRGLGASRAMDVVPVGGFGHVVAVAASPTRVFAIGDGGVAMYDRLFDRWLPPIALPLDDPARAPTLAAVDGSGETLWITNGGRVWVVNPTTRLVGAGFVSGDVREILLDRMGRGAYLRANGWWAVSPTGALSPTTAPAAADVQRVPRADELLRETPGLASFASLLTRDAALRSWELSALARAPDRSELWAGSRGGGLFQIDPAFLRSTQRPFGLRGSRGALALAAAADGIWVLEAPDARRLSEVSLTFASDDLTRWRWLSPAGGALEAYALAARERWLCVGTALGPLIVSVAERDDRVVGARPDTRFGAATRAAASARGCWLATEAGLVRYPWPDEGSEPDLVEPAGTATGLAVSGDTLWTASPFGVTVRVADGSNRAPSRLMTPGAAVRDVALLRDGLAIVTDDALWVTHAPGRAANPQRLTVPVERIRPLRRVVADDRTIWIGGANGAIVVSVSDGAWQPVVLEGMDATMGGRRPAPHANDVRDILLTAGVGWLATGAGIVRIARDDRGLPR